MNGSPHVYLYVGKNSKSKISSPRGICVYNFDKDCQIDLYRAGYLSLSTVDILSLIILCCGGLCIVHCLIASLSSHHHLPVDMTTKNITVIANVLCYQHCSCMFYYLHLPPTIMMTLSYSLANTL